MFRLRSWFGCEALRPLRRPDAESCQRLYDDLVERTTVDTHRSTLGEAKTFLRWCVRRRFIALNPAENVLPVGRRRHGKPQLRVNEARAWMRVATTLADGGEPGAVAALMALLMGMRASEIIRTAARDVNHDGRLLWIPFSKTDAGRRVLEIPDLLRSHLLALARGRAPQEPLFPHERAWVRTWAKRICRQARVPVVCAHAMRGLHSTLAISAGVTPTIVASALGHASTRATLLSYADPLAVARVAQQRMLNALRGAGSRRKTGRKR
jgi:integrase